MDLAPLSGMSGIPIISPQEIPHEIGTEIHFLSEGKIFIGLLRSFNESEVILQCGRSIIKTIQFDEIIGFNPLKTHCHTYELKVNVGIEHNKAQNRTVIMCLSQSFENINGVSFYSINDRKLEGKTWEYYALSKEGWEKQFPRVIS